MKRTPKIEIKEPICQHKNLEFHGSCTRGCLWCRDCEQEVWIPQDAFIGFLEWRFPHEKKD